MKPAQFFSCSGVRFKLLLDPLDIGVAVGNDLFGGELRRAALGQRRLASAALAPLAAFAALGCRPVCRRCRPVWHPLPRAPFVLCAAGDDTGDAGDNTDNATDRAPEHAADRTGGLVALARALLDALITCASTVAPAPNARSTTAPTRNAIATARARAV